MNRLSLSILTGAAILVAGAAHGADLGVPYTKAAAPAFSWTGCYAGTQGGLGSAHTKWQDADTPGDIDGNAVNVLENTANTDMSGAYYGGQLGCDYQFAGKWLGGDLVLGLQGMFGLSNITGTNMDQFNATWSLRDKVDRFGSLTGRLGTTITDRTLVYVRGGVAWAHNQFEIENNGFNLGTPSTSRAGWTVSSGLEFAITPSWTFFLETSYYGFNAQNVLFAGNLNPNVLNSPFNVKTSQTMETFQVGLNYRFWTGR